METAVPRTADRGVTEIALTIFNQIDGEMKQRGMTRTELAARAGVNRTYVSRILNHPENVTLGTIVRLANALDLEVQPPRLVRKAEAATSPGWSTPAKERLPEAEAAAR
jgi:transcriptional regulator with XRE-family HTH domain